MMFAAASLGCVAVFTDKKADNWKKIKTGLSEDEVVGLVGKPGLIAPHGAGKLIYYYPTSKSSHCVVD